MKKNVIWAFIANIAAAGLTWAMLLVLTKLGSPVEVGLFALAQAVALPVQMFFTFKLRIVQSTDHRPDFTDNDYRNFRIFAAFANFVVTAVLGRIFYTDETYLLIVIIALSYSFMIYREFYISVLQKLERNDRIALSNIVQGVFSLLFFSSCYFFSHKLWVGMIGLLISRAISTLFLDKYLCKNLASINYKSIILIFAKFDNSKKFLKLLQIGLPLGGVALLGTFFTSIPRIILEKLVSVEAVGYYAALSSLLVVLNLFVNSFAQSLIPRFSLLYSEHRSQFLRSFIYFFISCVCFSIVCVLTSLFFGKQILTLLFTEQYADYSSTFLYLMIAGAFLVSFSVMNMGISAQRSFSIQLPVYLICTITIFIGSIALVPKFGINGAAYAYAISNFSGFIFCFFVFIKNIKKDSNENISKSTTRLQG